MSHWRPTILGLSYFTAEDEDDVYARLTPSHSYEKGDRVINVNGSLGIIVGLPTNPLGYFWVWTEGGGCFKRSIPGANAVWRIGAFTLAPADV